MRRRVRDSDRREGRPPVCHRPCKTNLSKSSRVWTSALCRAGPHSHDKPVGRHHSGVGRRVEGYGGRTWSSAQRAYAAVQDIGEQAQREQDSHPVVGEAYLATAPDIGIVEVPLLSGLGRHPGLWPEGSGSEEEGESSDYFGLEPPQAKATLSQGKLK